MAEANNTTSVSPAPPAVIIYPAETITSGIYCLIVGILGVLVNTLTLVTVWKNKKLHTTCFALLAAHAMCGWLLATGFINDGIQRLGIFFKVLGVSYSRLSCYLMYIPKTVSTPPGTIFACAIGLDRLYGVILPHQYKKHAKKFITGALIFGTCVALGNVLAAGLTAPSPITGLITCANYFVAFHPTFTKYYTNHNMTFCILAVCIYAAIGCVVRCRSLKSDSNDRFLQLQLSILPMVAYVFCGVCPEIMAFVSSIVQNGVYQPKVVLYSSMLKATSVCTDFCVLMFKCLEYKATVKRMFNVGSPSIVPSTNTGPSNRSVSAAALVRRG